jgi:hypothetical protein
MNSISINDILQKGGVAENKLTLEKGAVIFPASTSTAQGGWGVSGDTVMSTGTYSFGGKRLIRFTATGGSNFCTIRRKVQVNKLLLATGRIDIPLLIPANYANGGAIQIFISKDNPVGDPPTATPANRSSFQFSQDNFKRGQVQVLSIHPNAVAGDSPNGNAWVDTGTVTSADRYETLYFAIYCPIPGTTQSATVDNWFEIGDIVFSAVSKPTVILCFDGAGQDPSHVRYVLPLLNKYGFKGMFAVQGQVITSNVNGDVERIKLLHEQGHDLVNEGLNHTNYLNNPATLLADTQTAINNYRSIGVTRGIDTVFACAQNALGRGTKSITDGNKPVNAGITDLVDLGFKFIRSTDRRLFQPSTLGREPVINFGAGPTTDGVSAANLTARLDAIELHGATGLILFHAIVPTVTGVNQTALASFTDFINDLGDRVSQGRMNVMSATQYIEAYEKLNIPS